MRLTQTVYKSVGMVLVLILGVLAVAWHLRPELFGPSWEGLYVTMAIVIFSSMGLLWIQTAERKTESDVIVSFVDQLCDVEHEASSNAENTKASFKHFKLWPRVLSRIDQCIQQHRQRAFDAEHFRASSEVRLRRMRTEAERMSSIVDGLSDPVIAINKFDELLWANPAARDLLAIETEFGKKLTAGDISSSELFDLMAETCRRSLPIQRTMELTIEDGDGAERYFRATCTGINDSTEVAEGDTATAESAVVVLNDISSEKGIQKRHAEFVSAASHEMKTPLAGIKAYVELLADGEAEDEETRDEFLDVINNQADRLQRLIENLLNLARIEAGVVEVKKEDRSLNELLAEAYDVVQPSADNKNIKLTKDLSPMYLSVHADRDMLMQTAINLLSNAVKYTAEGGSVTLRSQSHDANVYFEVEDTGVGLNEEDQQRVFDKFYRVKKDKNMASGTGLGLPLAKHIAEDVHGGKLTLTSQLGKGSTFRVTMSSAQAPQWAGGA